ncbi:hypothetical protein [Paenibacillus donghaensis]|uniref:Alpha/beta hydrolase n=1 Tax=Paenibacillus donghaensis TaxID=414771 RepID=A0A2Z2KSV6_9BACL|nr:hypothetical protein [Paenibacillus donghaensis]ASA24732.1 hypothetical protein B9T62_30630 [Paenibacillus donghaensis]
MSKAGFKTAGRQPRRFSRHPLAAGWAGCSLVFALAAFVLGMAEEAGLPGRRGTGKPLSRWIGKMLLGILAATAFAGIFNVADAVPSTYIWFAFTSVGLLLLTFTGPVQLLLVVLLSLSITCSVTGVFLQRLLGWICRQAVFSAGLLASGLAAMKPESGGSGRYWLLLEPDRATDTEPGANQAATWTYGGVDSYRKEFTAASSLPTPAVDGSDLLAAWSPARRAFFGFGPTQLPLNGRVWMPEGEGPFPLVLAVHGNHPATEASDRGLAYLGQLLAARGYICASIDQNFLNTLPNDELYTLEQLKREIGLRGRLILEHLGLWQHWNESEEHRLCGTIDLSRIALIGHGRGSAAVIAAALQNYVSRKAAHEAATCFEIASVVSLAGTDADWRQEGTALEEADFSFLALQGSEDMEVSPLWVERQYRRIGSSAEHAGCKALINIQGADHSSFNTVWGRPDGQRRLAAKRLLSPARQQQAAAVFISAFLDATLRGEDSARRVFRDSGKTRQRLPGFRYSCRSEGFTETNN